MSSEPSNIPTGKMLAKRLDELDERLKSGGGGGTFGGMDAWQTSVEKRLDSLDRRTGAIEAGVSDLKERAGRIETKIDHLPGKGFVVSVVLTALTAMSLIVAIFANIDKLVK